MGADDKSVDSRISHPPPPGGYGAAPPSKRFGPMPLEEQAEAEGSPRRSLKPFLTVSIVVVMLSTLGVIGVVWIRRYIAVAKTAEGRTNLAAISMAAITAYETEGLCRSASLAIPVERSMISGRKYQSTSREWHVDEPNHAGFACLHYQYDSPQYFQYTYEADATSFVAHARADLDGNGVYSDLSWGGKVLNRRLVRDAELRESNTDE
jgi:hypothetical protein